MSRSSGIPVTVLLDPSTFNSLEHLANSRRVSMRDLLLSLARQATVRDHVSTKVGPHRTVTADEIDEWERAARSGVTNNSIAERWGVSKSLVSRRLRERGMRRQLPRPVAPVEVVD